MQPDVTQLPMHTAAPKALVRGPGNKSKQHNMCMHTEQVQRARKQHNLSAMRNAAIPKQATPKPSWDFQFALLDDHYYTQPLAPRCDQTDNAVTLGAISKHKPRNKQNRSQYESKSKFTITHTLTHTHTETHTHITNTFDRSRHKSMQGETELIVKCRSTKVARELLLSLAHRRMDVSSSAARIIDDRPTTRLITVTCAAYEQTQMS
jgi:hypothetical protein